MFHCRCCRLAWTESLLQPLDDQAQSSACFAIFQIWTELQGESCSLFHCHCCLAVGTMTMLQVSNDWAQSSSCYANFHIRTESQFEILIDSLSLLSAACCDKCMIRCRAQHAVRQFKRGFQVIVVGVWLLALSQNHRDYACMASRLMQTLVGCAVKVLPRPECSTSVAGARIYLTSASLTSICLNPISAVWLLVLADE